MEHRGSDEAEIRLNLMSSPNEVFEYYQSDQSKLIEAAERLLALRGYEFVLKMLRAEFNSLLENEGTLKRLLSIVRYHCREFEEAPFLDALIKILMELALSCPFPFESFKTCQTISDLVVQNKQFPSKSLARSYFAKISTFFRESNQFLAYLNALHILNELESTGFSRKEFEFLKECAASKTERFPKDLFCGIKMRGIDSIVVDNLADTIPFTHDPMWNAILDGSQPLAASIENAAFLMKNGISYELLDGRIKVSNEAVGGFTTTIFSIAKMYEPVASTESPTDASKTSADTEEKMAPTDAGLASKRASSTKVDGHAKPIQRGVTFKNRFILPYKQLKVIHKYAPLEFEDKFYQERNERRLQRFSITNRKFEEEKAFFASKKDVVDDLFSQLGVLVEKRQAEQRAEAEERRRLEESRLKEERKSQMWSSLSRQDADPCALKQSADREAYVPKFFVRDISRLSESSLSEGVYVPKFSTRDISRPSESLNGGAYVPKFSTRDIGVKSAESTAESPKDTNEKPLPDGRSWGSLRKRKND